MQLCSEQCNRREERCLNNFTIQRENRPGVVLPYATDSHCIRKIAGLPLEEGCDNPSLSEGERVNPARPLGSKITLFKHSEIFKCFSASEEKALWCKVFFQVCPMTPTHQSVTGSHGYISEHTHTFGPSSEQIPFVLTNK